MLKKNNSGFTLVEITVAITIMAILIYSAVPMFRKSIETSKVDIASTNLQILSSAQRLYYIKYKTFAADLTNLENEDLIDSSFANMNLSDTAPFAYSIDSATTIAFSISATRQNSEFWSGAISIDDNGDLTGSITSTSGDTINPPQV